MKALRIAALGFIVALPLLGTACVYDEDWGGRPYGACCAGHYYGHQEMHRHYKGCEHKDQNEYHHHDRD